MNARIWRLLAVLATALCVAVAAPVVSGCSGCEEDALDPALVASLTNDQGVQLSAQLSDSEREDAARLVPKISDGRFPGRVVSRERNAKLILFLAAKSDRPEVIIAALRALPRTHASAGAKGGKPKADDDYGKVVTAHLASKDPKILEAALKASGNAVKGKSPHAGVLQAVAKIAGTHPVAGARLAAIDALAGVSNFRANPVVAGAYLQALDFKSGAIVSHLLYKLYAKRAKGLVRRAEVLAKARRLMSHADPGVRGRGARLAAVLAPQDAQLAEQIRKLLDDKHAYTRSAAAHALADMGDVTAIHALMTKVEDFSRNNHHPRYDKLGGGSAGVPHGSKDETVHDPVILAIEKLSAKLPAPYKRASTKRDNAGRKKNVTTVKAWYEKNKAKIDEVAAAGAVGDDGKAAADAGAPGDEKEAGTPVDQQDGKGAKAQPKAKVIGKPGKPKAE